MKYCFHRQMKCPRRLRVMGTGKIYLKLFKDILEIGKKEQQPQSLKQGCSLILQNLFKMDEQKDDI